MNEWMNLAKHLWKSKASCWEGHNSCVLNRWVSPIELNFSRSWTTGRPQVLLAGQPISSVVAPRSFCLHLCDDTYQALAYADDANLIGVDINTIEVNTDVVLNARKDIGLAVNTRKTMYMDTGRHGVHDYKWSYQDGY